jgi:DNA-binding NarL/FixJ family response regulator
MTDQIRVAIVEDQRQTREGLALLIGNAPGFRTTGQWPSMEEALAEIAAGLPDVLLADIGLPGISGIDGVRELKSRWPSIVILMLTVYADNERVFAAICAGASGYLLKDTPPEKLLAAIAEAHGGGAPMSSEVARKVLTMFQSLAPPPGQAHGLSARELQALKLLVDGHAYKTAAHELGISLDTMRFHIRNIYEKLHVHSKSEAVSKAIRSGLFR